MLQCVRMVDGARTATLLLGGVAAVAWCGEYRVDGPDGRSVYTTAALIRAWNEEVELLPRPATHSLWAEEARLRIATARLTVDLRATLSRAVRAGLLDERVASSLVQTVRRAVAMEDSLSRIG